MDKLDLILAQMHTLSTGLKELQTEVSGLKTDLGHVQTQMGEIQQDIALIRATMATKEDIAELPAIRQAVIEIDQRTIQMKEEMTTLKAKMVTKGDLRFFEMKIGEHDREIFNLKLRG